MNLILLVVHTKVSINRKTLRNFCQQCRFFCSLWRFLFFLFLLHLLSLHQKRCYTNKNYLENNIAKAQNREDSLWLVLGSSIINEQQNILIIFSSFSLYITKSMVVKKIGSNAPLDLKRFSISVLQFNLDFHIVLWNNLYCPYRGEISF